MDNTMNTISKLTQIRIFTKVLSKVSKIRNRGAKQKVLNALEKNEYFQRFIHDTEERQQFLTKASPYIKYRFYPKGTAIVELQKPLSTFSVIVKGKALVYKPKSPEVMRKEFIHHHKAHIAQIYIKYMAAEQLEEKFKKWLNKHELGTKALRKRMASLNDQETERETISPDNDKFNLVIEDVLKEKNPLLPPHLRDSDLSFEEKLLLLSTFGSEGEHLSNGHLTLKSEGELRDGETFGEAGLLKPIHPDYMIVAAEDTHVVSFTRLDYKMLFASDIKNLAEKVTFLRKVFLEIPKQCIMEMAYYLEEKILFNSEMAYREGEEVDAIYFVKQGEIEITATREVLPAEDVLLNEYKHTKPKSKFHEKHKIMVGRLPTGSIFGEEEILKRMDKRKYTAKALHPSTFLYVIRKKIFYEIFATYFPEIVNILKDWMDLKYQWREQRIKKEQEIADLRSEEDELPAEKKRIKKVLVNKTMRGTVRENDYDNETQIEDTIVTVATSIHKLSNISINDNYDNGTSKVYSTKSKRHPMGISPRDRSQPKLFHKNNNDSKDIIQTKEGIEKQKTRLFIDNQSKSKLKRHLLMPKTVKNINLKKQLEIPIKTTTQAPPILNFEKVQEILKTEGQTDSFRKITPTYISPRPSHTSQHAFDADQFARRHSSYVVGDKEQENIPMKTMDGRRGTVATEVKNTSIEDEKFDEMYQHKKVHRPSIKSIKAPSLLIRPITSQHIAEKTDKSFKCITSPNAAGSLGHLDNSNEDYFNDLISQKKPSISLKEMNFGKKVLSARPTETSTHSSSRPSVFLKPKVNRISYNTIQNDDISVKLRK